MDVAEHASGTQSPERRFRILTEALDLITPAGVPWPICRSYSPSSRKRFCENERGWLAHARHNGKQMGRAPTDAPHGAEVRKLFRRSQ
jgi:hypothetical protein